MLFLTIKLVNIRLHRLFDSTEPIQKTDKKRLPTAQADEDLNLNDSIKKCSEIEYVFQSV